MNIKKEIEKIIPGSKLIYLTLVGSELFGTKRESSDRDIKGIYLPSIYDIKKRGLEVINLSTNKEGSNNCEDIDIEVYSLDKFLVMIKNGDSNAIDMLFSMFSISVLLETKESFVLRDNYKELISADLKKVLSYTLKQTEKYGKKGKKLSEITLAEKEIEKNGIKTAIKRFKKESFEYINVREEETGIYLEIAGKKFRENIKTNYVLERLNEFRSKYGERSKSSETGIDYKSLSHAYRIVIEIEELIETGFIEFPLKKSEQIKKVKEGNLEEFKNYKEMILNLKSRIEEIKIRIQNCGLKDRVEDFTINRIKILILSIV